MNLPGPDPVSPYVSCNACGQVHLDADKLAITSIDLLTAAEVPGIEDARFQELATQAKENCPVSKALAGVEIAVQAQLQQ